MEIPFIRAVDEVLSGFTAQRADSGSQACLLIATPAVAISAHLFFVTLKQDTLPCSVTDIFIRVTHFSFIT